MKRSVWSAMILVAGMVPVAMGAQSQGTMAADHKMDAAPMMETTYVGCLAAGSSAGTFTLDHPVADMGMKNDGMKGGGKKTDTMKKDTMSGGAMAKDDMSGNDTSKHDMTPGAFSLKSTAVDLSKHLGHKVSVTGSLAHDTMDAMAKDAPVFTVKSLKMIGKSCS
jgi:hypothetical protein